MSGEAVATETAGSAASRGEAYLGAGISAGLVAALDDGAIAARGLAEVEAAEGDRAKADALARTALAMFEDYFTVSRRVPLIAKHAFETRDWPRSVALSHERIKIFSESVERGAPVLQRALRAHDRVGGFWNTVEERFRAALGARYEAELALAYLATLRRRVYQDTWTPVNYHRLHQVRRGRPAFLTRIEVGGAPDAAAMDAILALPELEVTWRDRAGDAATVAERLGAAFPDGIAWIDMIRAGFYRNRGAYLVGELVAYQRSGETIAHPFALALLLQQPPFSLPQQSVLARTLRGH
ncbi:MAG: isocitrate dehydrogenase kinase/phosphatase AceK regulatory subunit [Pseudomonadota bacterium]